MAGGMSKRGGGWGPMADRVAAARRDPAPAEQPSGVRPCWVNGKDGRQPGLLLEWRKDTGGWMARVVRPTYETDGWVIVEEWLPGELLEQG